MEDISIAMLADESGDHQSNFASLAGVGDAKDRLSKQIQDLFNR